MLTTILVPLDGSALAERALPYAVSLARAQGGRLLLVRATLARTFPGVDPTEAQIAVTQQAESELAAVAERLRAEGVGADLSVHYDDAAPAILETARFRHADLIVMSTHGRTGLGRWIYGSVADQVLRRAQVPVLLVPAAAAPGWPADRAPRLLVPLDGSPLAEEALGLAGSFVEALGADLLLLRVVEPPSLVAGGSYVYSYDASDPALLLAETEQYLETVAARLRAAGRTVAVQTVVGQPASAIADLAREQRIDAIVMATHGRGGLARLVMGSVATATIQRASVPLLLVRPTALRQPAAEPSAPPQAEQATASVGVTLSPGDLHLVNRGLASLLRSAELDEHEAASARALLARLKRIEPSIV